MKESFPHLEEEKVTVVSKIVNQPVERDLFHGYNISPTPEGQILRDGHPLTIMGWIVGKTSSVVAVEIAAGTEIVATLPTDLPRAKLMERFGDVAKEQGVNFGFREEISVDRLPQADRLVVKAVFDSGKRVPIGSIHLETRTAKSLVDSGIGPDFIIIGAMKAATTAIYDYLQQHPNVIHRLPKELHFFSQPQHYAKGWSWYLSNFKAKVKPDYDSQFILGEASPSYLLDPEVPARIKAFYPSVKFIVSLRNPTDRAISHYYHQVKRQKDELRSIEEAFSEKAIEQCIEATSSLGNHLTKLRQHQTWKTFRYLYFGQYASQLEQWFEFFPRDRILILNQGDLEKEPEQFIQKLFQFLELPDRKIAIDRVYTNTYPDTHLDIVNRLNEYFKPFNQQLEKLLDREFNWL
ncbi:MAG: sulfotransferase domain-containing protein [Geitlerinemataceae cyanobacterium]